MTIKASTEGKHLPKDSLKILLKSMLQCTKCSFINILALQSHFSNTRKYNILLEKLNLLTLFALIILFFGSTTMVQAQQAPTPPKPDSPKATIQAPPKVNPLPPSKVIPTRKKKGTIEKPSWDIAKTQTVSYFPASFKIKKDVLSRKYYNNNLFDIEESDNPFALPVGNYKSKQKSKAKDKKGRQLDFSELFALNGNNNDQGIAKWLIFILLGLLSLMAIIVAIYSKEVTSIFQTFLSTNIQNNQRDQGNLLTIARFSSYILFVLGMGTFCFLIPQILLKEFQFNTFGALCLFILGLGAIYFLKHIQLKVLSYILPFRQEIESYSFIVSNTNKALGFIIVPLLFLIAYTPTTAQIMALYFSFILLSLIYIYRTLKGLAIAGSIILFHKFHFFVYLCAVEIAPIVILLKLLSIL